jgi:hypothetical protein
MVCDGTLSSEKSFFEEWKRVPTTSNVLGPETRITAIAAIPGAVDRAHIVSFIGIGYIEQN